VQEKQVVVCKYDNELQAEMAKGCLEASGISAIITKDDGGGMLPSLQGSEGVHLLVVESQEAQARKILQA